ncbi:transmembrane protein [methanogenic archaeon ISO4-H5]|nr:transmembrane protein [methanogenic archaeon ISO4-H5]
MDFKEMNPLGIIGIIGAIILVVGVFLNWMTVEGVLTNTTWTGWEIYGKKNNLDVIEMKYTYVPLLALICGIISIVLMIIPTIMNTEKFQTINNILGLVALILAIVVVVLGLLWYMQSWTVGGVTTKLTDWAKIGIGFWLVLVGGIITLIGGIMPILKNKVL